MQTEEEEREQRRVWARAWRANNREHCRAYDKERRARDLDKRREQSRRAYSKDRDRRKLYARQSYQDRREWLDGVEHFLGCFICGEDRVWRLEWHHLTSAEGRPMRVTEALGKHGYEAAIKEMKSCVLLCANCHLDAHYWMDLWPTTKF